MWLGGGCPVGTYHLLYRKYPPLGTGADFWTNVVEPRRCYFSKSGFRRVYFKKHVILTG